MSEGSHLELPISGSQRLEWAADYAKIPQARENDAERKLFLFRLGEEWFGLEPSAFAATLPDARPRRLPHRRNMLVEGVVVFDGRVVTCLSLQRFFNLSTTGGENDPRRLLVLQWKDWIFAIRVDEAAGVEELREGEINPLSQSASDLIRRCASGVILHRKRAVTCLEASVLMKELEGVLQ